MCSMVHRWQPLNSKCKTCKQNLHQEAMYCQSCAYQKGICAMCVLFPTYGLTLSANCMKRALNQVAEIADRIAACVEKQK